MQCRIGWVAVQERQIQGLVIMFLGNGQSSSIRTFASKGPCQCVHQANIRIAAFNYVWVPQIPPRWWNWQRGQRRYGGQQLDGQHAVLATARHANLHTLHGMKSSIKVRR
jgi:hypothetical protein